MRRVLTSLLLTIFSVSAYSQTISGTVLDGKTGSPVEYAIVYFNGTFNGTYTDKEGQFMINLSEKISGPLTISSIGYYSINTNDIYSGKRLLVYLNPKIYELDEVVVSAGKKARQKARKANLVMFKKEFLGNTMNAYKCKIENEDDIVFSWDPDSLILRAFCEGPLVIDNKSLGYKVAYYLDIFIYSGRDLSLLITGNIIFREDASDNRGKAVEKRRKSAYMGSRMHFFRELWANNLDSSGFQLKTINNSALSYEDIVAESEDGSKYLNTKEVLHVLYFSKYGGSRLRLTKDSVLFEKDGYYDALGIEIWGEMGRLRIADWLPYEYSITEGL